MELTLLEDLRKRAELTNEAEKFCIQYKLLDLHSIINFFTSESTSVIAEKIPNEIKINLQNICQKYLKANDVKSKDVSIRQVAIIEEMSQRSLNVCIISEIFTLSDLLNYRSFHGNFLKLRNCGLKSNLELLNICKKYNELILNGELNTKLNEKVISKGIIEISSVTLTTNFDLEILSQIENMSVRSSNICRAAGLTSLRLILNHYINSPKQFLSLHNCGVGANQELVNICEKYRSYIIEIKKAEKEYFKEESSPLDLFINNLKLDTDTYLRFRSIISSNDQLPVFATLNCFIDTDYIFRKKLHTFIFKLLFHCYIPHKEYTLEEIGNMVNLTRERVRQIREKILKLMGRCFGFLKNLNDKISCFNYFNFLEPIIYISNEDADRINSNENTNFSPLFITYIFSIVYTKEYAWFGNTRFVKTNNPKHPGIIKYTYLIDHNALKHFKIEKFIKHLISLNDQKRYEDTTISFSELFKSVSKEIQYDSKVLAILQLIIRTEFEGKIGITSEGIVFFKNREKPITIMIVEILQQSYKPLHYTEIHEILLQNDNTLSVQSIHSILNRESKIFGLKGPGMFDLISNGGYFGTIGDVAEKILLERKEPVLLKELVDIICKELVVSKDSIKNNLFFYENECRFIKLRNGYVSLKEWQNRKLWKKTQSN